MPTRKQKKSSHKGLINFLSENSEKKKKKMKKTSVKLNEKPKLKKSISVKSKTAHDDKTDIIIQKNEKGLDELESTLNHPLVNEDIFDEEEDNFKEKIDSEDNIASKVDNFTKKTFSKTLDAPLFKKNHPQLLLSSKYNRQNNKATLMFYDAKDNRLNLVDDPTGHEPFFIVKLTKNSTQQFLERAPKYLQFKSLIKRLEEIEIVDRLFLENKTVTKIFTQTPGDVPKIRGLFQDQNIITFESDIRYHINYLFDQQLIPGMHYILKDDKFEIYYQTDQQKMIPANQEESEILEQFKNNPRYLGLIDAFLPLFVEDVPNVLIYALDIEVGAPSGIFPQAVQAAYPVICVSVVNNNGEGWVLYLNENGLDEKELRHKDLPSKIQLEVFESENHLLNRLYDIIPTLPIIATYNGDAFDIPYLFNRNRKLKIKNAPLWYNGRMKTGSFSNSIHLDLYRWFSNPAIRLYAYSGIFKDAKLDTIAQTLTGEKKFDYSKKGLEIWDLQGKELIYYCWKDTLITVKLLTHNDYKSFKIMSLISRITHVPLDELVSRRVSSWLQYFFQFEHRRRNYLIPAAKEIKVAKGAVAASQAVIKDKKFQGAIVIDPVKGIHFDVTVLDFASLYPSIISSRNLSYETIQCKHETCHSNKVPGTYYHVCTKETGIISQLVGFLKDIRVEWFKKLAKSKTHPNAEFYKVIEKSLKVLINAAYGVLGAEFFSFYCLPVAESTTAVGRHAIQKTVDKCQELGVEVLYGDTDSVFVKTPPNEIIKNLIDWSDDELGIALEIDKEYRFIALTDRKKNYIGVLKSGALDIKGVLGKKSNTPKFIQDAFQETLEILQKITTEEEFTASKENINEIIKNVFERIKRSKRLGIRKSSYKPIELAFTIQLTKFTDQYEQNVQHVKAARQYEEFIRKKDPNFKLQPGSIISYIKGKNQPIPLELAKEGLEIDLQSYKSHVDSTFAQLLEGLELNIQEISSQTINLSKFF
ncbi:MAG: type B DNA-directed DNA polymerase [Candidatus Hodarchaeales archaeon]|jgi:DNA polymerase I